jgi:hypothetical protein
MRNQLSHSLLRIVTSAVTAVVLLFSAPGITAQTPAGEILRTPEACLTLASRQSVVRFFTSVKIQAHLRKNTI